MCEGLLERNDQSKSGRLKSPTIIQGKLEEMTKSLYISLCITRLHDGGL